MVVLGRDIIDPTSGAAPGHDTAGSPYVRPQEEPGTRPLPVSLRVPLRKPVRAQAAVGAASGWADGAPSMSVARREAKRR